MSEEQIAAAILLYGFGFVVTLLSVDDVTTIGRKASLWPVFWLVLVAQACIDLDKEVRR
ncbi:MAG: hypothetical protein K2Y25_09225 [Pseudomonadaceae bacterium]|nr:hypothetical protein [Pseudomonadaceae bacterium]